jgi:putative ABC transport system permease protein
MSFVRDLRLALESLRHNPLRSTLTLVGIAVGIAAVLYVVTLGEAARARIEERLANLGANVLLVQPGSPRVRGVSQELGSENLTRKDAEDILAASEVVTAVVPEYSGSGQVEFGQANQRTRITGTVPAYETVNAFRPEVGEWFQDADVASLGRVALLGADVAKELFPEGGAVGETIAINDVRFRVLGVLASKGGGWRNPDEQVFVPLTTAQTRLFGVDHVTMLYAQVRDPASIQEAFFDIETVIRRNHRLRPDQPNDFRIRRQDVFLSAVQETNQDIAQLILLIALISLVVGGIGIANVMLISVFERTREIGVRRALGARRGDILRQFLVESAALSLFGGVLGVVCGAILNGVTLAPEGSIPLPWIGYSFGICAGVGILSGLYPAVKAAHLDVIDALRYE